VGTHRIWLLRIIAASMLAGDIGLVLGSHQFSDEPWSWQTWLWLPFLFAILNWPYFVIVAACALLLRRQSASLWLLTVGITLVASASLYFRWADYEVARQAWEARMAGHRFMCCAPPGRLASVVLDYVGVGFVSGLAVIVVGCNAAVRFLVGKSALSKL
jgi:hypothetical protein